MGKTPKLLAIAISAAFTLAGCTKISLSKGGSSTGGGDFFGLANIFGSQTTPVTGEWQITYILKKEPLESFVTFKQQGKKLTGQGHDVTDDPKGVPFIIQNGSIDGTHVRFAKKYFVVDSRQQPVEYNGELTFENDAEYKGWTMGGHYRTHENGENVEDKWVAVNASSAQETPPQKTATQPEEKHPAPAPPDATPPAGTTAASDDSESNETPQDISVAGMFTASYDYNFKRIESRLWLKQNGNLLSGDGTDTNTGEYFVISKGYYRAVTDGAPARIMLQFHYEKGKHANSTRNFTIHAVVNPGPVLSGETQLGSPWTANFISH